jgi:2-polyprenyl-3-methyl-5-hydroxy-6-metoxy-1,4-benzoquinol methylase
MAERIMRISFIENYNLERLSPADYNPRKLESDKFLLLQESIKKFGVVKPLIVNGDNNILTAGHQRTRACKAIGLKEVPVIKIHGIKIQDEIRFNLFHNSIETNKSKVKINNFNLNVGKFQIVPYDKFSFSENKNAVVIKEIGKLILRYGEWGSIVANEKGEVILNSDYVIASQKLKANVICYTISSEQEKDFLEYLKIEYGQYNYDTLNVKTYNQLYCQMNRLVKNSKKENKSTLYENYVIPMIKRDQRILDFGAGRCAYVNLLKKQGYNIFAYEPNFQNGTRGININEVVRMIKAIEKDVSTNGLFDVVILDSVLNSVINNEVEKYVILTCNSFLKSDGKLFIGTRNLDNIRYRTTLSKSTEKVRSIEFLDKNNFTATFRDGVWTMQHFHNEKTLYELLKSYFKIIKVDCRTAKTQAYCIAELPKKQNEQDVLTALEYELNLEYPNGFKHNQHKKLMTLILNELKNRNIYE